jgi:hypothetical protein
MTVNVVSVGVNNRLGVRVDDNNQHRMKRISNNKWKSSQNIAVENAYFILNWINLAQHDALNVDMYILTG